MTRNWDRESHRHGSEPEFCYFPGAVSMRLLWSLLPYLFSSVQLLSHVQFFVTPWIAACQASLSITLSQSSLSLTSIESVMPSSHLILCRPLLLLPPILPSIRVFSSESALHIRWPKYWSFSFSIIPSKEIPGVISFRMDWLDLSAVQGTLESLLQHQLYPRDQEFLPIPATSSPSASLEGIKNKNYSKQRIGLPGSSFEMLPWEKAGQDKESEWKPL